MPRRSRSLLPCALIVAGSVVLGACGGSNGGDNPALTGKPVTYGPAVTAPAHALVPTAVDSLSSVEYPQVMHTAAAKAINAALLHDAQGLVAKKVACAVSVLRSDVAVLSFRWTCAGDGGLSATFDTRTGRAVNLKDLFTTGFLKQLSATAITQLMASGLPADEAQKVAPPTEVAFGNWSVDDQSLQVTFMIGSAPVTVSFPLATLSSIIRPGGALSH